MMLKLLLGGVCGCTLIVVTPFIGPLRSGAWRLLAAAPMEAQQHDVDPEYQPLHKGYISLGTGIYVREDEDLIVRGTPTVFLRRIYRSGFNIQREFGIGTTHNAGLVLEGDPDRFQWVQMSPDGTHVRFERISSGTSYSNALFEHRSSPSEWQGARVGWTGTGWAVRRRDGTVMFFQGCGQGAAPHCWILWERDADGHRTDYTRDATGRLLRIEASPDRWIAFDYDARDRITRAYASDGEEVRYEYDERGRLSRSSGTDGTDNSYTYTERNELAAIDTADGLIENTYDQTGRVIKQVNSYPNDVDEPYTFDFTYKLANQQVVEVESKHSDGTWRRLAYANRYPQEEIWGAEGYQPLIFKYERDRVTNIVSSVTLTCPDRKGRSTTHEAVHVQPESEEWTKWDLVRTVCAWRQERWLQPK
jgi:YD repeat-containing protein